MDAVRPNNQGSLVGETLRRYLLPLVLLGLLAGVIAALVVNARPHSYTATSKVLVAPSVGNALSSDSMKSGQQVTVAMETESALALSPSVANAVAKELHQDQNTVIANASTSVPPNTQMIEFTYTDSEAGRAQQGAQKFAESYLALRKSRSEALVKQQLAVLEKQRAAVAAALKSAGSAAAVTDAKPDANAEVQLYAGRLATIQNNIATQQSTSTSPGSVVVPAAMPSATTSIVDKLIIPVAALLAMLLGFLAALWLTRGDDRIRRRSVPHAIGETPLLGSISAAGEGNRELVDGDDHVNAEQYRLIRADLLAGRRQEHQVVTVLGADETTVSSDVAANIALSMRRAGYRCALVDAGDAGRVHTLMGLPAGPGLAESLGAPERPVPATQVEGVTVVTAGELTGAAREMLHSDAMRDLVADLRNTHDVCILSGGSAFGADGAGLMLLSDEVVLVAEQDSTRRRDVREAIARCRELGTRVLGFVLVPSTGARRGR